MDEDAGTIEGGRPRRPSRRALLTGGAAAVGAMAAAGLTGVSPALATQGQPVIAGQANDATDTTLVTTSGGDGLHGRTSAGVDSASGVLGESLDLSAGQGVHGKANNRNGAGVLGENSAGVGVRGQGGGESFAIGVHGVSDSENWAAVWGQNTHHGIGVRGTTKTKPTRDTHPAILGENLGGGPGIIGHSFSGEGVVGLGTKNGVRGIAESSFGTGVVAQGVGDGNALRVKGPAVFSRSGTASVKGTSASPRSSVKVSGVHLTASSLVLALLQASVSGVSVVAAVPDVAGSSFTLHLNRAVTTTVGPIAWFIVN